MSERCGFFDNDAILWFIILFLLLFFCNRGFGTGCDAVVNPVC